MDGSRQEKSIEENDERQNNFVLLRKRVRSGEKHLPLEMTPMLKKRITSFKPPISFKRGQKVKLFVKNLEVGCAALLEPREHSPQNSHPIVTSLHGYNLNKWEREGQNFVVITKICINQNFKYMSNPYNFQVGIEVAPNLLGEMFNGGLYPWDVNMMSD